MAGHKSAGDAVDDLHADEEDCAEAVDAEEQTPRLDQHDDELPSPTTHKSFKLAMSMALGMVIALASVAGWLAYRAEQSNQANHQRTVFLDTARQAAVNLTTLSYSEIDADVKRIVDSSTGNFHDEFQQRAAAFIDAVKQAQSKSVGTVTAAGVQSMSGPQAQVMVAVSVKTSNAGVPEDEPRAWRMRISVTKDGEGAKVSDVQFVP
ncbi:mammalian cell entry protein [Mycobacterium colombiense]|uniref:mammalian cell entry protein n=1 Tax=Mycobacterium colombiense TaxID=339268 RepID=UPI00200AD0D0|nr:mammalian cell entry protein [Mycobacterium colombiense]MCK8647102.1 mammalian cell entry protein [Mycobacterium colombiense]